MEINNKIEDLILRTHLMTNLDILIIDRDKIVYFIGDTELCHKFLYNKVSNSLRDIQDLTDTITILNKDETCKIVERDKQKYYCQAICRLKDKKQFLIYFKLQSEFTENELFMIKSNAFLVEKFLEY